MTIKTYSQFKAIAIAVVAIASASSSIARMVDAESQRPGTKDRADRDVQRERDRNDREHHVREQPVERPAVREVPAPPANERPKTSYIREANGGITVVQSTRGGSQVSHLRPDGTVQRGVSYAMPRHAEYLNMAQRTGGTVVSKPAAEQRITEIMGGETPRQKRERQEVEVGERHGARSVY